ASGRSSCDGIHKTAEWSRCEDQRSHRLVLRHPGQQKLAGPQEPSPIEAVQRQDGPSETLPEPAGIVAGFVGEREVLWSGEKLLDELDGHEPGPAARIDDE